MRGFDLMLSTILSQAYERAGPAVQEHGEADCCAGVGGVGVLRRAGTEPLAVEGAHLGVSLMLGLVATPLAPIAKDLSSACRQACRRCRRGRAEEVDDELDVDMTWILSCRALPSGGPVSKTAAVVASSPSVAASAEAQLIAQCKGSMC